MAYVYSPLLVGSLGDDTFEMLTMYFRRIQFMDKTTLASASVLGIQ